MPRSILVMLVLGVGVMLAPRATAQTGDNTPFDPPMYMQVVQSASYPEAHGAITAYVDGAECGTTILPPARAENAGSVVAVMFVGEPAQFESCRPDGATVTFANGRGQPLAYELPLNHGAWEFLDTFVPVGETAIAEASGSRSPMLVQLVHPNEVNLDPQIWLPSYHPSATLRGSITVFVGDVDCGTTLLPPVENRLGLEGVVVATIPVGTPDQPAACALEGAVVYFRSGDGGVLGVTMRYAAGTRQRMTNFTAALFQPGAPGDGGGFGSNTGPFLPVAGSGGAADGGDDPWLPIGLATAGAVVAAGGVLGMRRLRPRA